MVEAIVKPGLCATLRKLSTHPAKVKEKIVKTIHAKGLSADTHR